MRSPEPQSDEKGAGGGRQDERPGNVDRWLGVRIRNGNAGENAAEGLVGVEGRARCQGRQDLPDEVDRVVEAEQRATPPTAANAPTIQPAARKRRSSSSQTSRMIGVSF